MGGAWCKQNLGKDFDPFRGVAKRDAPLEWRRAFGFTLSAHFSIAKFGEAGAAKLFKA